MESGRKVIGMLAAMSVLSIFGAGSVLADDGAWKANYGQFKLGGFQPTGDLDDADFDAGVLASGAYGRYLTRYLVVETVIEGFAIENDVRGTSAGAGSYEQDNTLSSAAFLVTFKGECPVGPVSLFGGIGGGFYLVTLDSDIDTSLLGDFSSDDDDDAVFGAHVVAGANYDITDRFFIGLEGMYRWTDELDLFETVALIPVEYSGDLSGFSVTVNGGYRF